MRLRSLELSDFRKFDRAMRLDGLTDGINVLAEPNEFGKSTLLAAIKAVLFEQHRAKNDIVRRMQHHRNTTSPVVRLGFELADGLHHIEKRFLHRDPYARLTLPDGTRIEGDMAEERLQTLLGFAPAAKRGSSDETRGVWGALWVDQQGASHQPILAEAGLATLHACLETELGALAGDDRSGSIRGQIETERAALLDGRGNPKGRFKQAVDEAEKAAAELLSLTTRRDQLQNDIDDLARCRRELVQATDPTAEASLNADLVQARARRDAVLRHEDQLRQATTTLQLVERAHAEAVRETRGREERATALAAAERAQEHARETDTRLAGELDEAEAAVAAERDAVLRAERDAESATREVRRAEAGLAFVQRSQSADRLGQQLERADRAQDAVNRLGGALAASPADATRLQAVETAQTALDRARAALDAQATEIELDLLPEALGQAQVNGDPAPVGQTALRATTDTVIEIAGIGRIRIRPAIRERAVLERKIGVAETALCDALAEAGATDLVDARTKAGTRRGLEDGLRTAKASLAAETPGDRQAGLAPGYEALRNHTASVRSRLEEERVSLALTAVPSMVEGEAAVQAARRTEVTSTEAVQVARTAQAGPEAHRERISRERTASAASSAAVRSDMARLCRERDAAAAIETDEALSARQERTKTELLAQQAVVAQMSQERPEETLVAMDTRIERLERAIAARATSTSQLRERRVELETRILGQEGEGLDEQIALTERRRDDARLEHEALSREATILTLLWDNLLEAEREARERYVAPLLRRVTPYLQGLFPGVGVSLDEGLRITGLTRHTSLEDIELLSDGTREQVAVLLRLAYADLLHEQGKPSMLILDDALAYSDRPRLETMFDVLTQASVRLQVLVLTCRVDAFERLGANRLRLLAT